MRFLGGRRPRSYGARAPGGQEARGPGARGPASWDTKMRQKRVPLARKSVENATLKQKIDVGALRRVTNTYP